MDRELCLPTEIIEQIVRIAWHDLRPSLSSQIPTNTKEIEYYRCRFYVAIASVSRALRIMVQAMLYTHIVLRTSGDLLLYTQLLKLHVVEWTTKNTNIYVSCAALYRGTEIVFDLYSPASVTMLLTCDMIASIGRSIQLPLFNTARSIVLRKWVVCKPFLTWLSRINPEHTRIEVVQVIDDLQRSQGARALISRRYDLAGIQHTKSQLQSLYLNMSGVNAISMGQIIDSCPSLTELTLWPACDLSQRGAIFRRLKKLRILVLSCDLRSREFCDPSVVLKWNLLSLLPFLVSSIIQYIVVSVDENIPLESWAETATVLQQAGIVLKRTSATLDDSTHCVDLATTVSKSCP